MRKRLIEKFTKAKEGSFGYTMTELLVVVAIIAIVAAIAIPSVIAISRALKFKRVNDHAKSIFLAAQQNLTEMRSDGGLKPLQKAGEEGGVYAITSASFPAEFKTEYVYTTTGTDAFELILPAGSVEATVRAEQIIIEYNPITGNVYSVFYSEEDESILGEYQSPDDLPRNADGDKSRRKDMMLGYYDGSGLNSSQLELEEVRATVEFVNGEEGIVRVLVPVPDDYFSNVNEYAQALKIDLTITGEYSMLHGVQGAAETGGEAADPSAPTGGTAATVPAVTIEIKNFGTGLSENVYVEYGNVIVVEYPIDSLMDKSSFANYAAESRGSTLTNLMDESSFKVLPGENVTIQADVEMDSGSGDLDVVIEPGILSSVNPMFDFLQPSGDGGYILAVSNGRNLQNLNAIAPTIAELVDAVVFTDDIYWNKTVAYYNDVYGNGDNAFSNLADEAPARALPYFVPIHNENLFGTAKFIFPGDGDGGLGGTLEDLREFFDKIGEVIFGGFNNPKVPTLTDEMDAVNDAVHASIQGNGHKVYNLNIDSNAYVVPHDVEDVETATDAELAKLGKFYAVGENQVVDYYFTGLFGYVNTPIEDLHVVNPIIKGHAFDDGMKQVAVYKKDWWGRPTDEIDYYETHYQYNNPATGALVGACGYNTVITNCSTYIDRDPASGYVDAYLTHGDFAVETVQKWYGVSGEGAVGGLVGYAKSHRAVNGELTNNKDHLAFSNSFAAVAVSGNMRKLSDASTNASGSTNSANPTGKDFGYSNGVGAFIGNSQLTNFYNCYASGDVKATNSVLCNTILGDIGDSIKQAIDGWGVVDLDELYGGQVPDLLYNGRTSWGAGGFVGTSHGTCYTNCFATGDISTGTNVAARGAGGFVGVMSIDETSAYGNDVLDEDGEVVTDDEKQIAQRSIFSSCYAVGLTTANGVGNENFSGGNGRIVYDPDESFTSFVGDYYRLYAVYYDIYKAAPQYANSTYYYRDTYFLNYGRYTGDTNNATVCGASEGYETLQNLPAAHSSESSWAQGQLKAVKRIPTLKVVRNGFLDWDTFRDYDSAYFQRNDGLENLYYAAYDQGYSPDAWESPADDYAGKTYPYTLSGSGAVYPFSKLEDLDYYGDWPAKPSGMGMAYYEIYNGEDENIHYIFDKERDTDTGLSLTKEENDIVTKDGFAIFSVSKQNLNVKVGDKTFANLTATTDEFNIEGKKYYAFLLPDEALNVKPAQDEFYVKVTAWQDNVRDENGNIISFIMYFNPDVALSHANPSNGASAITKPTTTPKTIYVRSARQFKALSTLQNFWTQDYRYIQQLNIDATQYDGWEDAEDRLVASIGNAQKKFDASYTAAYTNDLGVAKQHSITGFQFANNASGFFGVIGENGTVEELIVNGDKLTVNTSDADAAVLAGRNEGIISNVDMVLENLTTLTAADNAGLLAGYSSGTVRDCEVSAAAVTVNAKNGGGLIGSVEGTANAKAKVSGCKLTLTGDLTVTGTGNAGGLIGNAEHLSLTAGEPLVSLKKVTATGENAGGLIGCAKDTDIKITDAENAVTVTADSITNSNGTAAGVLGGGKTVTLNSVDVEIGSVSGDVAAGFLGTGTNVDASFCDVVIKPNSSISGTDMAAGMAGTIGPQSVFNLCTVTLTDVTVSATAGNAAGYAVEIAAEAEIRNSSVTLGGSAKIEASNNAAGYACTVAGYVGNASGSAVSSSVVGEGTITGKNAAGFACDITGQVASSFVTPALAATKDAYKATNNSKLNVKATGTGEGEGKAAGFALTVGEDATVTNCYALNQITGDSMTGFVGINKGSIDRCMANVTIPGGNAFVATNDGTVTRCYGWYGDGDPSKTETNAKVGGNVYSAYFVDLNPVDKEGKIVVLYTPKGEQKEMTATELQGSIDILAGDGFTWYKPDVAGGYESYPYTAMPENMPKYLYPMLRDHYGDWILPPQYAYGVAYYEIHSVPSTVAEVAEGETTQPTTVKLHMVDLSDEKVTEEGENGKRANYTDTFDNTGTIVKTGYAVFSKSGVNVLSSYAGEKLADLTYTLKLNDSKSVTYDFYELKTDSAKDGVVTIGATAVSKNTAAVQTWFADAINVTDNTYRVRTPEQLAKIGAVSASFSQTHDIVVPADKQAETAANIAAGKTYAGDTADRKLTFVSPAKSWLGTVSGTVNKLTIEVRGDVSAPVVHTIADTGTVSLKGLTVTGNVASNSGIIGTVNGKLTGISEGNLAVAVNGTVSGSLITTVNGAKALVKIGDFAAATLPGSLVAEVKSGTVNTGAITVSGDVSGKLFGTVGGTVKTGNISVNTITGLGFEAVENKVTTGNIIVNGDVATLFGKVTNAETGTITVQGTVTTQLFGDVSGTVNTGAINTRAIGTAASGETAGKDANIFGDVTGGSLTVASINTYGKAVNGNVFGEINGTVNVGTVDTAGKFTGGPITTGAVTGNVFGDATAAIKTGDITVNGDAGKVFGKVAGAETGNITVSGNAAQVFGAVNAEVSTGAITTGKVTNVFGDVESGKVTTQSIAVNGDAGQIFGDVKAPVEVTDGITTAYEVVGEDDTTSVAYGDVGQVFGEITLGADKAVNVGGISVGNVTGSGVIASVGNDKDANAGTITLGTLNVKAVGTSEKNANIIGNVNGGAVTATSITAGNVSGNIVGNITSGTVTTGDITVASLSGKLAGSVDGTLTGTADSTKATISLGTDVTLGKLVTSVSGTLKNYSINVKAIGESVIPDLDGTVQNVAVSADTATFSAPVLVADNDGNITSCSVSVGTVSITGGTDNIGVLANEVVRGKTVSGTIVAVDNLTISGATGNVGILVGKNSGTISGSTVTKKSAKDGSKLIANLSGTTVGGLTGSNAGTLTDNTVNIGTVNTDGIVTGGLAVGSSNTTVGGLVGVNTGKIGTVDENGNVTADNTSVTAYITYTPGSEVTIGGLIGENSGTVNGATVAGAIKLASGTGEGKKYIIGGAVGKDGITSAEHVNTIEYQNVVSSVTIDTKWAKTGTATADCPAGKGAIGMFAGSVHSGTFSNCSSDAANENYQFLGTINVASNTIAEAVYGTETKLAQDTVTSSTTCTEADKTASKIDTSVYTAYAANTAKTHNYTASLDVCTFVLSDAQKIQYIDDTEFFYTITEDVTEHFNLESVNMPSFADAGEIAHDNSVFSQHQGKGETLTNYYCKVTENNTDKYYRVYVTYTFVNKYLVHQYECVLSYKDENGDTQKIETSKWTIGQWTGNVDGTINKTQLYTLDLSGISVADGKYLITGFDGRQYNVLCPSEDGTSVSKAVWAEADPKFTSKNAYYNGIWKKTGNTWTSDRYNGVLNLGEGNWFASGATVTASAITPNGCANADFVQFDLAGTQHLSYANGAFSKAASATANINLWSVTETHHVHALTYTYVNKYDQACEYDDYTPPQETSLSEETIPAEEIGGETGNNT